MFLYKFIRRKIKLKLTKNISIKYDGNNNIRSRRHNHKCYSEIAHIKLTLLIFHILFEVHNIA